MKIIASADRRWGIGCKGKLLVRIPNVMKNFREETTGNLVIMGRKTLESFPGGRPLPDRINVVFTRSRELQNKDVIAVHSLEELQEVLGRFPDRKAFVIGGGEIYRMLLPYCDEALITKIDHTYEADTYLPDLDADPQWELTEESDEWTYFDLEYRFLTYRRKEQTVAKI